MLTAFIVALLLYPLASVILILWLTADRSTSKGVR